MIRIWLFALAAALLISAGCNKEEKSAAPAAPAKEQSTATMPAEDAMKHAMDKAHEGATGQAHEAVKTAHDAAVADMAKGKEIYQHTCFACHDTGAAGAPKLGDKEAWAPHLAEGLDHLVEIAIAGEGAMPPRGGNPDLSDDDIRAAVTYMLDQAR